MCCSNHIERVFPQLVSASLLCQAGPRPIYGDADIFEDLYPCVSFKSIHLLET